MFTFTILGFNQYPTLNPEETKKEQNNGTFVKTKYCNPKQYINTMLMLL